MGHEPVVLVGGSGNAGQALSPVNPALRRALAVTSPNRAATVRERFPVTAPDPPVANPGESNAVIREFEAVGVPVVPLRHLRRSIHPLHDFLAVRELKGILRRLNPDLVSAHTAKAGCIARLACAGTAIPRIYTPHGWAITDRISRGQGMVFRSIERATAPLATTIVNVCQHRRRIALRYRIGCPRQHTVVHNGMPDVARSLRSKPWQDPPRIVMSS